MSVGIEAADRAVAFAEDAAAFFDERLDLVDEFLFVELFFRGAVGFFDVLARDWDQWMVLNRDTEKW
jgi:hypothetical protein